MKLIIGLGNPGEIYSRTRHNIGFEILNKLCQDHGGTFSSGKGDMWISKVFHRGQEVLLLKPSTFMNLSGFAVQQAISFYKASILDMLVICDDIYLSLGVIRLRAKGSDGGHNGLKHIIGQLGRHDFSRLRVGVGMSKNRELLSRYVLSEFRDNEIELVKEVHNRASEAACSFILHGIEKTMSSFNRHDLPPCRK